jgi:small ligand-binding sensory domain FIST
LRSSSSRRSTARTRSRSPRALAETLLPEHVVGCSAGGIIGAGREVEERPALSITAARLPGVQVHPFRFDDADLPDEDAAPRAWEAALGVTAAEQPHFLVLADPFSFPADLSCSVARLRVPRRARRPAASRAPASGPGRTHSCATAT